MDYLSPATPEVLRAEVAAAPVPGTEEPSALQFGCEGCPSGRRLVAGWLPVTRLIEMMNTEEDIPRGFVSGCFASIGKARTCPVNEETNEPDCQYQEELKTIFSRINPFPE